MAPTQDRTENMKLSYRAVKYESEPMAIDMMESEIGGQYRGQEWKLAYPRHIPATQPMCELKYRGVPYRIGETAKTGDRIPAPAAAQRARAAATPTVHPLVLSELAKVHHANICKNLERRLQSAKAKGDKVLIQLLEKESQQITCSLQ